MTDWVVDVGCATWGNHNSVDYLINRFHPVGFLGLDPAIENSDVTSNGTSVLYRNKAAWIWEGEVNFSFEEINGHITPDDATKVECVDLAGVIAALDGSIVLKLDCEGAEYPLLDRLIATEQDKRIDLIIVEWHKFEDSSHVEKRKRIEDSINCKLEEWF